MILSECYYMIPNYVGSTEYCRYFYYELMVLIDNESLIKIARKYKEYASSQDQ